MTKRKRVWWLCEFCWMVFSTRRSALKMHHNCSDEFMYNASGIKIQKSKPLKLVEAE